MPLVSSILKSFSKEITIPGRQGMDNKNMNFPKQRIMKALLHTSKLISLMNEEVPFRNAGELSYLSGRTYSVDVVEKIS